ncbi:hypothetical protein FSU_2024 [Fibrobacter succinogenes subsp. succinogenes S85]|uniref:Uncharacterized protein n=1 Tax=Fibrobacter succinogenes (strain ATCC 19169 / S85) TaxID=59374 RepID=C9RRF3_FIBSS|nr:hypothetical protein [Fibrobacter succinogenes]ACX75139.1 hypothetical protein Fisuc_1542 [Fibrobacter succinogenes subsp. succinogenes S85]ADL27123.1 hypothetical protein FSU_2024 [Fibrobacter succinogenes subsp. succinogenes S85]
MATWNIGIDEKGRFGCFTESKEGPSVVCAFITQKNGADCEMFLKGCAALINRQKFDKVTNTVVREHYKNESDYDRAVFEKIVENFYHARAMRESGREKNDKKEDPLKETMDFLIDLEARKDFFEKIFVSPQNKDFVGSRQNYYLNSLYEVLSSVFESGIFKPKDSVNVYIAQRALEVIGYEFPADIVVRQLRNALENCASSEVSNDIENAIKIIHKYGDKQAHRSFESVGEEKDYKDLLKDYHDNLAKSIRNFLTSSYPNVSVGNVVCQSAKKYVFPAMADIAGTLVDYGVECEKAKKRSLVKGLNIKAFIEDGDFDAAAQLIGQLFYAPKKVKETLKGNLVELFISVTSEKDESITRKNYDSVWKILTDHCIGKMHNRGVEGELFLETGKLINLLDEFIDAYKPSPVVYARYLKMKGEFGQHSGSIDLDAAKGLAEKIKGFRENCRDKEVYAELYDLEEEFWIESCSQFRFNLYDFDDADYKQILKEYKLKMKRLPFWSEIYKKDDIKDRRYSVICGTIGQALAFSGDHKKAIEYLLEDYRHTNYMKNLPASFLVVEYLRKGELENAVEWFKNQVKEVLGKEKTIEQFFLDVEDGKKVDNWLVLNFLRIWAYSMKIGKPVVQRTLSFEKWTECNFDEYPGGLVLKWAAICNHYAKGSKETTVALLNKSIEVLTKESAFAVNSLALSPMRVLNVLDAMPIENYAKAFDDLCKRCESFAKYAKANPVLDPKTECKDVWDAAMILPFNYA